MMNVSKFPWTLMFLFIPVFCFESAEIPNSNDSLIFAQIVSINRIDTTINVKDFLFLFH